MNGVPDKKWLSCLLWLALVLLFAFVYAYSPMQCDDYRYSVMFSAENGCLNQHVTTWGDYLRDACEIYKGMEGRLSNMLIAWVMTLGGGKSVFNILAVAVVCALLWGLCRFFFGNARFTALATVAAALLFFIPARDGCVMWASGAVNYLWGSLLLLAFLIALRRRLQGRGGCTVIILGLLCGCYHEALALPLLAASASVFILKKETRRPYFILTSAAIAAGVVILLASPGHWHRADSGLTFQPAALAVASLTGFINFSLLPFLALLTIALKKRRRLLHLRLSLPSSSDTFLIALLFFNAGLAMAVGYAGNWGGGYYYFNFAMLLATLRLLSLPTAAAETASGWHKGVWVAVCLLLLACFSAELVGMARFGRYMEDAVVQQARAGQRVCVVNSRFCYSQRLIAGAPGEDPSRIFCKPAAFYWGINHPYYMVLNDMMENRAVYRGFAENGDCPYLVAEGKLIIRLPKGYLAPGNEMKGTMPDGRKCVCVRRMFRFNWLQWLRRYVAGREVLTFGVDYAEGTHYVIVQLRGDCPESLTLTLMNENSFELTRRELKIR